MNLFLISRKVSYIRDCGVRVVESMGREAAVTSSTTTTVVVVRVVVYVHNSTKVALFRMPTMVLSTISIAMYVTIHSIHAINGIDHATAIAMYQGHINFCPKASLAIAITIPTTITTATAAIIITAQCAQCTLLLPHPSFYYQVSAIIIIPLSSKTCK